MTITTRLALILAPLALLAACAGGEKQAKVDPYAKTRDPACYTVDIFDKITFHSPGKDVPEDWRGFAGRWGGGKWNGKWCHDLYVLDVASSGAATVIETHAPLPEWGKPASAFKRKGVIDKDGRLHLQFGKTKVTYWIEGDTLYGMRDEGLGEMIVALSRRPAK